MGLIANRVKRQKWKQESEHDDNIHFLFWLYPRRTASEADREPRSLAIYSTCVVYAKIIIHLGAVNNC